uniref:GRAS30 n=1 Tax=Arundo donax TaxID=35708 RepID=A0A0A9GDJ4_ARUDO
MKIAGFTCLMVLSTLFLGLSTATVSSIRFLKRYRQLTITTSSLQTLRSLARMVSHFDAIPWYSKGTSNFLAYSASRCPVSSIRSVGRKPG